MKLKTTIGAFLLTAAVTFAQPQPSQTGTLNEPADFPIKINGAAAGNIKLPTGTKVQVLQIQNGKVLVSAPAGSTWVEEKAVTIVGQPSAEPTPRVAPTPAAIATTPMETTPTATPTAAEQTVQPTTINQNPSKKILVGANNLNRADRLLVEKLKEKGYEIVLISKVREISEINIEVSWTDKSQPPYSARTREGKIKPDLKAGEFPVETLQEYCAFIFPSADEGKHLNLPMEKILGSNKLVVLGEVPNVAFGEKSLLGNTPNGNYYPKSYQIVDSPKRISYVVYSSSWKVKKFPTEEDNKKFVETELLPRILSSL